MIHVTKTYLPDIDKYKSYIDKIYESGWLTNNGSFAQELQRRLEDYLQVRSLLLVSNGTLALQIAYKLLGLKGEVITTPFSFVATTSSIVWEGLTPVFVDIDPETLNIDPSKIEEAITPNTSAIVATHVYGNACDIERIQDIADKYKLKVIYDAAHAFGVQYKDKSILNCGDISTISFHSTKTFHTIEGGALRISDKLYDKGKCMINFGFNQHGIIEDLGINTKVNEFQAAMGLCVLDDYQFIVDSRKRVCQNYVQGLSELENISFPKQNLKSTRNYGYFPVIFESEDILKRVFNELNENQIFPRRYFYPSLDQLSYVKPTKQVPISNDISKRIACLPVFHNMNDAVIDKIISIIKEFSK
ncbi:DegT/DnrJ/EryC1/StrS family aminotransferase [Paenibacillus tyrfis]|uniref:DegT/DnrJ/EryC1/StrS family aminotransferase n=1 Tax=Paenibacillus tyrfis TaxID=1501230 RepID=UPI000B59783E|nr:DegT/DnrJ/EryC1/StrS family aminotransferase [Paenibacillus tyrfis]